MSKKLIINADDYGIGTEVNDAIENLINAGRLKNVSVLANGWSYEQASAFLKNKPHCSVGVHLNVIEGVPLSRTDAVRPLMGIHGQFVNLRQIFFRWASSPFAVTKAIETEWRTQIELLLKDGLTVTHADSHQHIHAFPPFWQIIVRLCREYGIPAVRYPHERNRLGLRRLSSFALGRSAAVSSMVSRKPSPVISDHFLGFKRAGAYGEDEMISDIGELKGGVTELIVHPSLYDGVPYSNMQGESEYRALLSDKLQEQIKRTGVELTTWTDFANTMAVPN